MIDSITSVYVYVEVCKEGIMPRIAKELTAIEVKCLRHGGEVKHNALHMVGGVSGLLNVLRM